MQQEPPPTASPPGGGAGAPSLSASAPPSTSPRPGSAGGSRTRLPQSLPPRTGGFCLGDLGAGAGDGGSGGEPARPPAEPRLPALDPPPFEPATVQRCIKIPVRIAGYDKSYDALILTSVTVSAEEMLGPPPGPPETPWTGGAPAAQDLGVDGGGGGRGEENGDEWGGEDGMDDDDSLSSSDFASSDEDDDDGMDCGTEEEDDEADQGATGADENGYANGPSAQESAGNRTMKAYWLNLRRPLHVNDHGAFVSHIYWGRVLHKANLHWVASDEEVAVKTVSWECIRRSRGRLSEDFLKEIQALQFISEWHRQRGGGVTCADTHVMAADTIMTSETHLYIVMPWCSDGSLLDCVARRFVLERSRLGEEECRRWFRQILKGLETLQAMGICHRDLSPENLIIMGDNTLVIDFGMCLRIPYSDEGRRHLLKRQTPCGKLPHMAPETRGMLPFDGHAVDLWAAGTILLFMLTGERPPNPPFVERALAGVDFVISEEAIDLLKRMTRKEAADRPDLDEVNNHPFVCGVDRMAIF